MESALRQKPIVNKLSGFRRICCENVLDKQTPCQSQPGCCSEEPSWQGLASAGKGDTRPRRRHLIAPLQSVPSPAATRGAGPSGTCHVEAFVGDPGGRGASDLHHEPRERCPANITAHVTDHLRSRDRHQLSPRLGSRSHPGWHLEIAARGQVGDPGCHAAGTRGGAPAFPASLRLQPAPARHW